MVLAKLQRTPALQAEINCGTQPSKFLYPAADLKAVDTYDVCLLFFVRGCSHNGQGGGSRGERGGRGVGAAGAERAGRVQARAAQPPAQRRHRPARARHGPRLQVP